MRIVAFDTETRGLDWFDPDQRAFLGSWADEDGEYHADLTNESGRREFTAALDSADILVAHNMPFDVHHVREACEYDILDKGKVLHDTDLMARLAYPAGQDRPSYKLKDLAHTHLDDNAKDAEDAIAQMAKAIGVNLKGDNGAYYDVWRAYPDVMEKYARLDARYTFDLHALLSEKLADSSTWVLEVETQPILIRAEQTGVALDPSRVEALLSEYLARQKETEQELLKVFPENALRGKGSTEALEKVLTEDLGIPLYRKTQTGRLQINKYSLAEFEKDFPILETLSEYKTIEKFLSTYLEPMDGRDTIHTSFGQSNAWTGRMSSYRPNLQNIPKRAGKEVREVFVPREGHSFVVCDYDSIEVRLLAYYMGRESYRALIREGRDPHAWMASQIHGGTMDDFAKDGPNDALRSAAKNTMFAITYGAGAPRVADMNGISKDEAKELITAIKKSLPGYYRLNKRIREKIRERGYVTTLFGRKSPVNPDKAYVGLNALIQGSAADIMKQGLINVEAAVRPLGGKPLLVVHDEVVVEVPSDNAEDALRLTKQAMSAAYDLDPPLEVTGTVVSTNYADA